MNRHPLPSKTIRSDSGPKRAAIFAAGFIVLAFTVFVVRWSLGNAASTRADAPEIAQMTTQLAPDDPQTHYAAGVLLEKQFDIASLELAVKEYEKAAILSPNNYLYWLALGNARERSGDAIGGELALRKALELAPHYARVHWALGNALVRQGRTDEGFAEIRSAVESDPKLADLAATTAWMMLRGNVSDVRGALGESDLLNASLAMLLVNEKRFDEALSIWSSLSITEKQGPLAEMAATVAQRFYEAGRYRDAARIRGEIIPGSVEVARVSNGGFEEPIKNVVASGYEWNIAPGAQPQIAPTNGQKHSGNISLVLVFNSMESKDFRSISQTVAVEPSREYELEVFYRADLRTKAGFRWEVVSVANNTPITATEPTAASAEWTRLSTRFKVTESDGVTIRLGRVNCEGPVCQITGNLWFDDIALKPIN